MNELPRNGSFVIFVRGRPSIRLLSADLALVDLDRPHPSTRESVLHECGWSAFEGQTLSSTVIASLVNGRVAYRDGVPGTTRTGVAAWKATATMRCAQGRADSRAIGAMLFLLAVAGCGKTDLYRPEWDGDSEGDTATSTETEGEGCWYEGNWYWPGQLFWDVDCINHCTCNQSGAHSFVGCTIMGGGCSDDAWHCWYAASSQSECASMDLACPERTYPFQNECGCGCQMLYECEASYDCMPPADCTWAMEHCPYSGFAY